MENREVQKIARSKSKFRRKKEGGVSRIEKSAVENHTRVCIKTECPQALNRSNKEAKTNYLKEEKTILSDHIF